MAKVAIWVLAGVFGLVHGAGFANYLQSVFADRIAVPLLGFNLGIELGQIAVLFAIFAGLYLLDRAIAWSRVTSGARIRYSILTDLFPDQVNVLQISRDSGKYNLLFTPSETTRLLR